MAEVITIPSPSVFLKASPPPSADAPAADATDETGRTTPTKPNARRSTPVQAKKKTAPRKPGVVGGAVVNGGDGSSSVGKPKQSKSRNGCVTCKAKRLKCDEEKPTCQQCARRNVTCGGYKKDFKWRPFEDTNVKLNIDRTKRSTSPKQHSGKPAKPPPALPNRPMSRGVITVKKDHDAELDKKRRSPEGEVDVCETVLPERLKTLTTQASGSVTPSDELPDPASLSLIDHVMPPVSLADFDFDPSDLGPGALSHLTPGLGLSPTLTGSLWPFNTDDPMHQDFVNYELAEVFQTPHPEPAQLSPVLENESIRDAGIGFIGPSEASMTDLPMLPGSGLPTPTSNTPGSPEEDLGSALAYIYPQPHFADDSREVLTFRFERLTCAILSIVDGPGENPWRSLMWPLVQLSPALYHAINAMAAYHSASDMPRLRIVGHEHKAASIRFIQEGIRDNSFSLLTAIATAIALALADAWDQHICTGISHIKGAQELVKRALDVHNQNPFEEEDLARLKFLCNAWVYMDVISRLTSVDSDDSEDFDSTYIFSGNPNDTPQVVMGDDNTSGFGIDWGMPVDTRLDPLMGCAGTLFPLIGRTANLVRKVCRSTVNSPAIISMANDIKIQLEGWDPPSDIEPPSDPTTTVQHTLQTAEAYRWATLLHLHSAVPELPSLTSSELAQRVLQYIATVPLTSRTVIVHIYPLMVAGCEAKLLEDRNWVLARWAAMANRMRLGVIEKASAVMQEVWRRRDAYEAQPSANRKIVPTTDLKINARRGSRPFIRSPSGGMRLGDPGHTGMVYSYVETPDAGSPEDEKELKRHRRARDRRDGRDPRMDLQDIAYTARGHLHWIGVMFDWQWEILLG